MKKEYPGRTALSACVRTRSGSRPSPLLVEVIVRQESGLNPLAVNIVGQSYYPVTREEADQTIWRVIVVGQR